MNLRLPSFCYYREKKDTVGFITNLIKVKSIPKDMLLRELVMELNEWYDKAVNLKEGLD